MPVTLGRVVFSDKEDVEMSLGRKSLIPILFLVVAFAGTWAPVWAQTNKYVYVANWTDNTVSGYLRDATTGALTQITGSPWSTDATGNNGQGPAGVTVGNVGSTGFCVFVANFISNTVSAYKITSSTGGLTPVTGSPFAAGTGPLGIAVDFATALVYVANAFSNDVSAYQTTSSTCALTPVTGSPFKDPAGVTAPASVVVDPSGSFVYVANEFSNNVSGFKINLGLNFGALTSVGPPIAAGTWPISVVAVPASGVNFIYVSNDGSNNVSGYSYNGTTGVLTAVPVGTNPIPAGSSPGLITISPGTRQLYVPNFDSSSVSVYNISTSCTPGPCTGAMTEIANSPFRTGAGPTSVAVDPSGKFAYVTSSLANRVYGHNVDGTTGALSPMAAPSPFTAGQFAISVFFTN